MDERSTSDPGAAPTEAPLPAERAFVIQFRAHGVPDGDLFVGRAEHIASGDAVRFGSVEDLTAFITRVLEQSASTCSVNFRGLSRLRPPART